MFRGKALLKNNGVLNFPSAASEPRARAERRAAPRRRARPRAQAPITAGPKLTQSAPENRGPPAVRKVQFPLHAPAEVGASLPTARQTPPPTSRRPPPGPVQVNPARTPSPPGAAGSPLQWHRAGSARTHSPHTLSLLPEKSREGRPGPTRTKAHSAPALPPPASPRPGRREWARRPRANVPSPDARTWRPLRSPARPPPALRPLSASCPDLRALPLGCGLPAKVSACPPLPPARCSRTPEGGWGERGAGCATSPAPRGHSPRSQSRAGGTRCERASRSARWPGLPTKSGARPARPRRPPPGTSPRRGGGGGGPEPQARLGGPTLPAHHSPARLGLPPRRSASAPQLLGRGWRRRRRLLLLPLLPPLGECMS